MTNFEYAPVTSVDLMSLSFDELEHLLINYQEEGWQHGIADYEIVIALREKQKQMNRTDLTVLDENNSDRPYTFGETDRTLLEQPTVHPNQTNANEADRTLLDENLSKSVRLLKDGIGTAGKERERHLNDRTPEPGPLGSLQEQRSMSFRQSPSGMLATNKKKKGGSGPRRPKEIERRYIERATNTSRFNMFQIHLQLWTNTGKGVAPVTGSIEYKKRNLDGSLDSRFEYCDFTPRTKFRRNLNSYKTLNKRHRFIEDPWWQELNKYLQWYDWLLGDLEYEPLLVSFSQHRIRGKKGQTIGHKRDDQIALMLLRNKDQTPHQLIMFNGPYAIKFKNFQLQVNQTTGHSDYRADWYK